MGCIGSSPRVRGPRSRSSWPRSRRGLIPARAGTTRFSTFETRPSSGSSPRVRGPLERRRRGRVRQRLIPARAGTTSTRRSSASWRAAHPRACGDHARGGGHRGQGRRLIPARAGATSRRSRITGSSPRVRGPQIRRLRDEMRGRLIPARAGTTCGSRTSSASTTAHPRACGDHLAGASTPTASDGSSPRVRGPLPQLRATGSATRLIPARAGTTEPGLARHAQHPAHPRACGDHACVEGPPAPPSRLIPARAGTTTTCPCP